MSKRVFFSILTIALGSFLFYSKSFASPTDHLVISQIQITGGTGKTTNDFVEIYNPTASDIDLKGMRLVKRTKTGATDTSIKSWTDSAVVKAHGFYLWANSSFIDLSVAADVATSGSIADDNGVAIRNGAADTGAIVDAVAWGAAANAFVEGSVFPTNPEANQSLERKPGSGGGNGEDSDSNAADFFVQTAAQPRNSASVVEPALSPAVTPPIEPSVPSSGETDNASLLAANPPPFLLEITEILPNPKGKDSGGEWVEFYNPGKEPFSLAGWTLDDDGVPGVLSESAWALTSGTVPTMGYLSLTVPVGTFSLNNSGQEAVRLFDDLGRFRLRQQYEGPAKEGYSFAKDSTGLWQWSDGPTPGSGNVIKIPVVYSHTVRVSEVLPNPDGDDLEGEYIEVFNFGTEAVDMEDWAITDGRKRYRVSGDDFFDTELAAGAYLVLYREITGVSLNNSGEETVELVAPDAEVVDRLTFDAAAREGESFSWDGNYSYKWTSVLTPGKPNEFADPVTKTEESIKPKTESQQKTKSSTAAPSIPVVQIHEIRKQKSGDTITTTGTVSVPSGVLGDEVAYLSGSGIRIAWPDPPTLGVKLGDVIEVTGKLTTFHNELQLAITDPAGVKITKSGEVVSAERVETGQVGEATEGYLVKLSGTVTSTSGDTFFIDDGSGQTKIYIRQSTGIEKPRMKKGDRVEVTGVVSQYNDDYRVLPRFQDDISIGEVLGAATRTLPRTGISFWLTLAVFPLAGILMILKSLKERI